MKELPAAKSPLGNGPLLAVYEKGVVSSVTLGEPGCVKFGECHWSAVGLKLSDPDADLVVFSPRLPATPSSVYVLASKGTPLDACFSAREQARLIKKHSVHRDDRVDEPELKCSSYVTSRGHRLLVRVVGAWLQGDTHSWVPVMAQWKFLAPQKTEWLETPPLRHAYRPLVLLHDSDQQLRIIWTGLFVSRTRWDAAAGAQNEFGKRSLDRVIGPCD